MLARGILKHTRTQEESADQAALTYMDKMGVSSKGLLDLLDLLYSKENTLYDQINPYAQTHPLSKERISHVKNHIQSSHFSNTDFPAATKISFELAIIKLNAFLDPYEKTLKKFPISDTSTKAHYARAIAYYKIPNVQKSLAEVDSLLKTSPNNPFFNEFKGQVLFENGKVTESIPYYQKASSLAPESALLKIVLATAQIASEKNDMLNPAINNLEKALIKEKDNSFAWNQLAIAYGRSGDIAMSNVCLAEQAVLLGNKRDIKEFIKLAKKYVKPGTTADTRLKDIIAATEDEK